jgi:hypothetical protein
MATSLSSVSLLPRPRMRDITSERFALLNTSVMGDQASIGVKKPMAGF